MMSDKNLSCRAEEVAACCCMDVGTVIDNSDLDVTVEQRFASEEEATSALNILKDKAQKAAVSGVKIKEKITPIDNEFQLNVVFSFECQAESMIFQLANR